MGEHKVEKEAYLILDKRKYVCREEEEEGKHCLSRRFSIYGRGILNFETTQRCTERERVPLEGGSDVRAC